MKSTWILLLLLLSVNLCIAGSGSGKAPGLEAGFLRPPESARPWVYWFWLDGNITRTGITADLEAMKRVGIGGVLIMEVDQGAPKGPARFGGPEWRQLFKFVLAEANRLGLEVNMSNDAGWCGSGGPWITPELAQKKIVWTETTTEGGKAFDGVLQRPQAVAGWYSDIAVLAVPTPAGETMKMADASPLVAAGSADSKNLTDGDTSTRVTLGLPEPGNPRTIQIAFARPFPARELSMSFSGPRYAVLHGILEASEDGRKFTAVREFDAYPPALVLDFDGVAARSYRISFTSADAELKELSIGELELSPRYRIHDISDKAAFTPGHVEPVARWAELPDGLAVGRAQVVDLTGQMDKDGRLSWNVPAGKWTILRIGYTPTGKDNHPAPLEGRGLECDKLDPAGADAMFAGLMAKLISDSKPLVPKALVSTHIDSWEVGSQNWAKNFRAEFQKRRGYDPLPFLPVMTGRVLDNLEVSERFLWDLRQTVSDLLVENYAGRFRALAHKNGIRLSIEAYDGVPADEMTYAGQADEPMSEFWSWSRYGAAYSCTEMSSAAHVYGKRILGAEAFTATDNEKWQGHPFAVKDLGDWAFCEGINRFVFHRYALQPWADRPPGMSMGPWGLHYERTETWWEQSRAWHEYLSRCQYLLQQGLFVADICCLEPEGSPMRFIPPTSVCPAGVDRGKYDFDGCTPEVILTRMKVKDGRLMLPDGMSYRLLVLPGTAAMTPHLLRKVKELVEAGATVLGAPPERSPGLTGYPKCDEEVRKLSAELWGGSHVAGAGEHKLGRGRVVWGRDAASVLADMGVGPDFSFDSKEAVGLRYIHRTISGAEVYFVANKNRMSGSAVCSFRVKGMRPELWWPDRGVIERPAVYDVAGGEVRLPIRFDPAGSVFVVFRPGTAVETDRVTSVTLNGEPVMTTTMRAPKGVPVGVNNDQVTGTFTMAVWAKPVAPAGLPKEAASGVFLDVARNDALYPPPGHEVYGPDGQHAGSGISIGTNGVCVYEHSASYFAPVLVYAAPIEGWKHVAVVYRDGVPELYLDGAFVHRGLKSPYNVHPGVGVRHTRGVDPFRGDLGEFRLTERALSEAEISTLMKDMHVPVSQPAAPDVQVLRTSGGGVEALVFQPGDYVLTTARKDVRRFTVQSLPAPLEITGPWNVSFAPGLGAPDAVRLEKLISWSEHANAGVKYYSGAGTYAKTFDVPAELTAKGRRVFLDLGRVEVMAEVKLNGKSLGVLWKAPYRAEVTGLLKTGANSLEVKVVNLWINRQIGDELLPEDSDRNPDGTLKSWPEWVSAGRPSPTGRHTFTSWRLWKKDDPLVSSGLLGPVTIVPAEATEMK